MISFSFCLLKVFSPLSRSLPLWPQGHHGPYWRRRPGSYPANKGEHGILICSSLSYLTLLNSSPDSGDDWTHWRCSSWRPILLPLFVDILTSSHHPNFFFQFRVMRRRKKTTRKGRFAKTSVSLFFLFVTIPNKYVVLVSLDGKTIKDEVSTHIWIFPPSCSDIY